MTSAAPPLYLAGGPGHSTEVPLVRYGRRAGSSHKRNVGSGVLQEANLNVSLDQTRTHSAHSRRSVGDSDSVCSGYSIPSGFHTNAMWRKPSHASFASSLGTPVPWVNFKENSLKVKGSKGSSRLVEDGVHKAVIMETVMLSTDVREVTLRVPRTYKFLAGQYAEIMGQLVGRVKSMNLSILSAPSEVSAGVLRFVVKISSNPLCQWLVKTAAPGDTIYVRNGAGKMVYQPRLHRKDLVLIGGGIGVVPLYSVIQAAAAANPSERPRSITLVYSAKRQCELIYTSQLQAMERAGRVPLRCWFYTSFPDQSRCFDAGLNSCLRVGRVDMDALVSIGCSLPNHNGSSDSTVYMVCGPPDMVKDTVEGLRCAGVDEASILYDRYGW